MTPAVTHMTRLHVKCERARVAYHYSLPSRRVIPVTGFAKPFKYGAFIRRASGASGEGSWPGSVAGGTTIRRWDRGPNTDPATDTAENQARDVAGTAPGGRRAGELRGGSRFPNPGARHVAGDDRFGPAGETAAASQNRWKLVVNHRSVLTQPFDRSILLLCTSIYRCRSGATPLDLAAVFAAGERFRPGQERKAPEGTHRQGGGPNRARRSAVASLSGTGAPLEKNRAKKIVECSPPTARRASAHAAIRHPSATHAVRHCDAHLNVRAVSREKSHR